MPVHHLHFTQATAGKGTYEITSKVRNFVQQSPIRNGIANVFTHHTSCSLVLMENADPSAREDLHRYFEELVPENTPYFIHTHEGADDMPSHIRMALTRSSETLPIEDGQVILGTWQGIFLFEHRRARHQRQITITLLGE